MASASPSNKAIENTMIGKTLVHYEILEKIGEGTMGEVYRARDTERNRQVALKVLPNEAARDPERLERLLLEARTIAGLDHPYIITIHSVEEAAGVHFITMELLKGRRLDSLISERGFSSSKFFEIAVPLADAIGVAHKEGVIPRNLKPANIMITDEGIVKILGFGLARGRAEATERTGPQLLNPELSDPDEAGTAPYMSPEQFEGSTADQRSEIYSLGVLFYEMIVGRRPFAGETADELISTIAKNTPTPVLELRKDLPEGLGNLIERCLEKDPARRPESTQALRRGLDEARVEIGKTETGGVVSIAVIPLVDTTLEKDQDYLCDGITEALIHDLGNAEDLNVVSRISAFQFKDSDLSVQEIGRRLDVSHVLTGTVRKDERTLNIAVQLTNVADGLQIWSAKYDRDLKSLFDIQAEIVHLVETRLHSGPGHQQSPPTTDVQAYEYYLRGRKFYYQYRRKAVELALRMFSTAIKHDPEFAMAHAGIADCYCFLYLYAESRVESLEQAEKASARALELNPELAEVHASRGLALSLSEKDDEAESEFQTALSLDPNLFQANYLYGRHCFAHGKSEQAGQLFEKASRVSPDDYQPLLLAAQVMDSQGREREAEETRRRGVKLVEDQLRLHPGDVRALYMGANALAALGEKERPLEWANLALVMEPNEPMVLYNAGCIYSLCGKIDDAIDALEKAARAGLAQKGWYEHDSDLDPVRDDYRFKALMRWLSEAS
jgi:serine/threonine protein kinase